MKLVKKLRKRWQAWRFQQQKPKMAERRALLEIALQQGREQGQEVCSGIRLSKKAKKQIKKETRK